MKLPTLRSLLTLWVLTLAVSFQPSALLQAAPLGTAFTYQGKLTEDANPASGSYDLKFTLYDALSSGNVVAVPLTNAATGVSNGLFTVLLDFGSGVFTGETRWLEIGVRPNGSAADFALLSPRQPLTASPYALFAPSAGAAASAATATTVAAGGVTTASLQANAVTTDKIADGAVAAADVNAASFNTTFWRATGNPGTTPGTHFLGTTDNQPLEIKVNTQRALRLEPGAESPNVIAGHQGNAVTVGIEGVVIGGGGSLTGPNVVMGRFGTIGGGVGNVISTNAGDSTISGGWLNVISPFSGYATLGGGSHNTAGAVAATVAGGFANAALGQDSVVAGGYSNSVASLRAAVVGGFFNRVEPGFEGGFIGSGYGNRVAAHNSSVVGGYENSILDSGDNYVVDAVIGGGLQNQISGDQAVIGGGAGNTNAGFRASIVGGSYNRVEPGYDGGFIGGGYGNRVAAANSSVVGGYENTITNLVDGFIGGGLRNQISANHTVIAGGLFNTNAGPGATIGGGNDNWIGALANDAFIGGGVLNRVEGYRSAITAGESNTIRTNADFAVIGGGIANFIGTNADSSVIGGGSDNTIAANAAFAMIPGGLLNSATNFAFAAGRRARAIHTGSFVWADSTDADFASTAANQFLIRANGGVGINKSDPTTALDVNGTVTATAFSGSGANLTLLSGTSIASGTVPEARIDAALARDSEVMSLVLASDGSGSGLNADLLDGLHSTAFATAAHSHYGASWSGSATKGLSVQTDATGAGKAALFGQEGTGAGTSFARPAGVWGDSTNGYGVLGSTYSSIGVLGFAVASTGQTYAVRGENLSRSGSGVHGTAFATSGTNYGVYGSTASTNGVGVYGTAPSNGGVAIKAAGSGVIQSTADSYVFVSGNTLVKNLNTDTTRWDIQPNGAARIWRGATAGGKSVYFPVSVPAQLYGQPVTVASATVYYVCSNPTNGYIANTICSKQTDADSYALLSADYVSRQSTVVTNYTLTFSSNNRLTSDAGALGFYLNLAFANDTDYVQIGGIRFRLSHD